MLINTNEDGVNNRYKNKSVKLTFKQKEIN